MKMLPFWLPLRLRNLMQQNRSNPSRRAAPRIEPMTIPAICPPDRPWCGPFVSAAPIAEELLPSVGVGNKGGIEDVSVGRTTPVQRLVTLEAAQQESVALGELVAQ